MTKFIIDEKGEEVISDRHQKDFKKEDYVSESKSEDEKESGKDTPSDFTDVKFEDI